MTKLVLIGYLVAIATVSTSLTSQPSKSATLESPTNAQTSTEPSATVANDSSALPHVRASDSLLTSIVTWLSTNFELEPTPLLPQSQICFCFSHHGTPKPRVPRRQRSTRFATRRRPHDHRGLRPRRSYDLSSSRLDRKHAVGIIGAGARNGSPPAKRRQDKVRMPAGPRATRLRGAATMAQFVRSHAGR